VIGAEGKKVREIWWANLIVRNAKLGTVESHVVWAGYSENPIGGGIANGFVQAVDPYECNDSTCALALGELKVTIGKTLPWKLEVYEPKANEFWEKVGFKAQAK
jgi:hypothetical protein